jgi:hypothetical protein
MKTLNRFFCNHKWYKPFPQKSRDNGLFGLIRQYEFKCSECSETAWSDYENIEPPI